MFHGLGTPAQKSDFTRTGKRTIQGLLRDGYFSLQRYVINNFADGSKQDAIDLLLAQVHITATNSKRMSVSLIHGQKVPI